MEKEGKYIYCIISTAQERNFGPIGIGERGDEVLTISYDDLSMVVSNFPKSKLEVSRQNLLAHEKIIEEVMSEFNSVLPVRFGTIASSAEEIRNLLDRRCREFKTALRDMDHKIELGVKCVWKDMDVIFKEIVEENEDIKKAKEKIANTETRRKNGDTENRDFRGSVVAKREVGKMVAEALEKKKEKEAGKIADALRRTAVNYKLNKTMGDAMFMNAAFLVDKGREKEFDNIMDDLSEEYSAKGGSASGGKDRVKFMYVGPLPAFNFVNIVIYPEEWEK